MTGEQKKQGTKVLVWNKGKANENVTFFVIWGHNGVVFVLGHVIMVTSIGKLDEIQPN